jgi:hypothetical protein
MPRVPSSVPTPPLDGACSEAMRDRVIEARDQAVRDFGEAEEAGDHARAAGARERVRKAQTLILQYGLDR